MQVVARIDNWNRPRLRGSDYINSFKLFKKRMDTVKDRGMITVLGDIGTRRGEQKIVECYAQRIYGIS